MPDQSPQMRRYITDVSPERVSVGDGVSIPRGWTTVIEGDAAIPGTAKITAEYDTSLNRAVVTAVVVERGGEGVEITSAILREVSVQSALQDSGFFVTRITEAGREPETVRDYVHRVMNDGGQVDMMRLCTTVYRAAYTVSLPPLKFVADQVGMSVSTATRWMSRARNAGLAEDLITRETYNRMQADERNEAQRRAFQSGPVARPGGGRGGPSMGM
ncbi:hypothetical protein GCM10023065_13140 [Microbacterium laevaniformans]|nr:hypothetical protein GCM10017578_15710 [Microbacterium laevaniformans]